MTYTLIEWTWTAIALTGVVVAGLSAREAYMDRQFLLENHYNGRRMLIAGGHLRRELLRVCVQGLGLYVGIYALSLPNPPGVRLNVATVCLMGMQALVVWSTILDRRMRTRLVDYWKTVDLKHVSERDKELGV